MCHMSMWLLNKIYINCVLIKSTTPRQCRPFSYSKNRHPYFALFTLRTSLLISVFCWMYLQPKIAYLQANQYSLWFKPRKAQWAKAVSSCSTPGKQSLHPAVRILQTYTGNTLVWNTCIFVAVLYTSSKLLVNLQVKHLPATHKVQVLSP